MRRIGPQTAEPESEQPELTLSPTPLSTYVLENIGWNCQDVMSCVRFLFSNPGVKSVAIERMLENFGYAGAMLLCFSSDTFLIVSRECIPGLHIHSQTMRCESKS